MKARKGFTLVELLVVVLVLAILAGVMVPRIIDFQKNAVQQSCKSNVVNLRKTLERYAIDNEGDNPADDTAFQADVATDTLYFPHGAPECPYAEDYVYSGDATGGTVTDHNDVDHGSP